MMNPDLKRSFKHFKRHEELGYLKLNFIHKVFLSLVFFVLVPSVLLNLFFKNNNKNRQKIFIFEYEKEPYTTKKEPYITIYKLLRQEKVFNFIKLNQLYIPVLPLIFIKDVGMAFKRQPIFMLKNLYFLGALSLKISKYYFMVKYHRVSNLIVFQEYSFYMSYFTRIMEYEGGNLYNIQHGIPGDTYCHFRFSKCFVWGEYFKQTYIKNGAEPSQFVITGSIFHAAMAKSCLNVIEDIDILYVMQGYAGSKEDTLTILELLNELSFVYNVQILQHPRHRIKVKYGLKECDLEILEALKRSKVVVGHYSTVLLDASYLGKSTLAFIGNNVILKNYLTYLDENSIITDKNVLKKVIELRIQKKESYGLSQNYIDRSKNPVQVIFNECHKNLNL